MLKVGDIVKVKEEQSKYVKYVYDTDYWSPMKRELGIKAAEGMALVVVVSTDSSVEVTDAEYRYSTVLRLEAKYFEKTKKEKEVDENVMFALL